MVERIKDEEFIMANALGLFRILHGGYLMPNTLAVVEQYQQFSEIVEVLREIVGCGNPVYLKNHRTWIDVNGIVYSDDANFAVYVPEMSYMVAYLEQSEVLVSEILPMTLFYLLKNGYSIMELIRWKTLRMPIDGRWVEVPKFKEESNVVVRRNINVESLSKVFRNIGRLLNRFRKVVVKIPEVSTMARINDLIINVVVPVMKIRFDLRGIHEIYNLPRPLMLKGQLIISNDHVIAKGTLKHHSNISAESGSVCLGTIPPFDGTLSWLARLLNTLTVARIDSCVPSYSQDFFNYFKDDIPPEIVRIYEDACHIKILGNE